jgi:hypothetical protein
MLRGNGGQGRYAVISALILAFAVAPFALASGEGSTTRLGARNPKGGGALTTETEIIAKNKSYGTRQSNKTIGDGGGAIYGCRSNFPADGKAGGALEPCVRGNNLAAGRAFEFNTVKGTEVGRFTVGDDKADNPGARPFSTNATGVATGLNADRVDGLNGVDLQPRFAVVASNGSLTAGRDATGATRVSEGTYDVTFGTDVSKCAYTATIAEISNSGAVAVEAQSPTVLRVATRSGGGPDGTEATPRTDRPFHLLVSC